MIGMKKTLYIKTLLMLGRLSDAFAMAKKEKSVGWSYGSDAGVVFGSALSVLANYTEKPGTIKTLLAGYADQRAIYSEKISIDDNMNISFSEEILEGLKQRKFTNPRAARYLTWAEKIGKSLSICLRRHRLMNHPKAIAPLLLYWTRSCLPAKSRHGPTACWVLPSKSIRRVWQR